jgi:uncharacterized cupredoxin-like copper-binding protein
VSTKEDELEAEQPAADEPDEGAPEGDESADEAGTPAADDGSEPPALEAGPALPDPVRDRLLLPLLLPVLAIAAVALYVLNISRVFLAGGSGAASVVTGVIVTVGILVGAAVISASPRLRSSTLTMTLALLMVVVVSAGLITLGPSEEHEEGGGTAYQEPEGPPTGALEVVAQPGGRLAFDKSEYQAPGGILEITYVLGNGTHTLLFEEQEFAGFELAVPAGPEKLKVEIEEGEYTIYCDIPGHRAGGMEATLTVTPPPAGAAPPPAAGAPTTTGAP